MIKCPLVQKKIKIANAAKAMALIIRSLDFGSGRTVFKLLRHKFYKVLDLID